jgi:hypothetical protein
MRARRQPERVTDLTPARAVDTDANHRRRLIAAGPPARVFWTRAAGSVI